MFILVIYKIMQDNFEIKIDEVEDLNYLKDNIQVIHTLT
jgi:hypothetical protein